MIKNTLHDITYIYQNFIMQPGREQSCRGSGRPALWRGRGGHTDGKSMGLWKMFHVKQFLPSASGVFVMGVASWLDTFEDGTVAVLTGDHFSSLLKVPFIGFDQFPRLLVL